MSNNGNNAGRINDVSYDIITVLQSKLEAVDAYETFIEDARDAGDPQTAQLFERIKQQDEQQVEQLSAALERIVKEGRLR